MESFSAAKNLGLRSLPPSVAQWQRLTALNLSQCSIEELPTDLSSCKNLITLNCSGNRIKRIPKEYSALGKLETLDLGNNRLSSLEPNSTISGMRNLKQLKLSHNALTSFPDAILCNTPVVLIELEDNPFNPKDLALLHSYELVSVLSCHTRGSRSSLTCES